MAVLHHAEDLCNKFLHQLIACGVTMSVDITLAGNGGNKTVHGLTVDDVALYTSDPIGFAARHLGVSKIAYLEWILAGGEIRCTARTKSGSRCLNIANHYASAEDWVFANKHGCCCRVHAASDVEVA
jgi:hypothetical protein